MSKTATPPLPSVSCSPTGPIDLSDDWDSPGPALELADLWDVFDLDDETSEPEPAPGDFWIEPTDEDWPP